MNRRSIVVLIAGSVVASTLFLGHGSSSTPFHSSLIGEPKVSSRLFNNPGLSGEQRERERAHPDANYRVPDHVIYGAVFRAIRLIADQPWSQPAGKKSVAPRQALEFMFNLDESELRETVEIVSAWDRDQQRIADEIEPIINEYRTQRSKTNASSKQVPSQSYQQLQRLQERLDKTILDYRAKVQQAIGDDAFTRFETAIEKSFAPNIKVRAIDDLNDPKLQKAETLPGSGLSRPTLISELARPSASSMLNRGGKITSPVPGKGLSSQSPTNATDESNRPAARGPQPELNFCFFGGFVFYGTFLWLVPQIDLVFQLSYTQLDICAGLVYDPYVYGELYYGFGQTLAESNESFGRSFFRPAIIVNRATAFPSSVYCAYSDHWILQCFEGCNSYFVDYLWECGLTPQCVPASNTFVGMSPDFATCPGPSPTPTPTPTVKIDSVGFTGDYLIRKWDKTISKRKRIDYPDGTEATWRRASNNPNSPVAYKRGTNPTIFATFTVAPAQATSRPANIRLRKESTVVATKDNVVFGGGLVEVRDIGVAFNGLESQPLVKRSDYEFTWEVSFDGGANWANAGKSKHKVYWTWDARLSPPFRNQSNQTCFQTADGPECDTLYDKALELSAGKMGNGSSDLTTIITKINSGIHNSFIYDPCESDPSDHPLANGRHAQCSGLANILRGALRSIGIDATTKYFWGGVGSTGYMYRYDLTPERTFQVQRPASSQIASLGGKCPTVEEDPHFKFHATVSAGGGMYDPSYGLSSTPMPTPTPTPIPTPFIVLLEASKYPQSGFFLGSDAAQRKVESENMGTFVDTGTTCSHHPDRGVLSPNPIYEAEFFVQQHYFDFLNREPDAPGLAFWTQVITQCNGNEQCVDLYRWNVSIAFFLSTEFQQRGYFVERFYKASYARNPLLEEFLPDLGTIGHEAPSGDEPALERNKQWFADDWVATEAFQTQYPFTMEHSAYVDALFANAGITPNASERVALINGLDADTETRATVLRKVVDNQAFISAEYNRAFILMCYFGYLRRNPNDPPDSDYSGYDFWLGVLNSQNNHGEIARAFILSTEYRSRFGAP